MRSAVDKSTIARWRAIDASDVLLSIAEHAMRDQTFEPSKDKRTQRWHVIANKREFTLLTTGPKFWDEQARTGGGGALDLACHLTNCNFVSAIRLLKSKHL